MYTAARREQSSLEVGQSPGTNPRDETRRWRRCPAEDGDLQAHRRFPSNLTDSA
ncbi:Hypothetical protein SMAX5B_007194 [Scophthalmus maximus]|uniref:Uncharacterized protein n=1 Tax=Scophthalmus maximus TaxID=52904 RepID=A0A2U9BI27_SCOMX|nr:Hypothetical protein SMAX5B_007194 [Scophthalmus maximus]